MDLQTCAACGKLAEDRLEANGKAWHHGCFKCDKCNVAFSGSSFWEHEGKAYHEQCRPQQEASQPFAGNCQGCRQELGYGEIVKAEGQSWHKACFICSSCKSKDGFPGGQYYKSRTGGLLCKNCKSTQD